MNLHIDNTLVGSVSVDPFALNTFFTKNYLGCDLSNGNLFEGKIAYFKTWLDYSLLPSEISDLLPPGPFEELLITIPTYYWEFRIDNTSSELQTQNNGDIVIKDSIGNRNATIVKGSSSISTSNFSIANGLDLTSQGAYIDLGSQLLDNMMENFSCEMNLERGTNTWRRILTFGESVGRNALEFTDRSSSTLPVSYTHLRAHETV
mgnify:FL=1